MEDDEFVEPIDFTNPGDDFVPLEGRRQAMKFQAAELEVRNLELDIREQRERLERRESKGWLEYFFGF